MSFLKNISIAGAVLGASMMLASSASAIVVTGDFKDDGGNFVADYAAVNVAAGQALIADSNFFGDGPSDQLYFEFHNTSFNDVFIIASINDNPDFIWDHFVATLYKADGVTEIDTFEDLPAPTSGNIFGGVIDGLANFILVLEWDGVESTLTNGHINIIVASSADVHFGEVPLPPSLVLFGSGLLGLGFLSARRRRKATSV